MAAILRPGTAPTTVSVPGLLRRLLPKPWQAFPGAAVRVRLDGGFASPAIFDLLEDAGVEAVVAMAKNPVLLAAAAPSLMEARTAAAGIKELHHALAIGRTSCMRFWANQVRVLLSAAAYVLTQTLQIAAAGTTLAHAQAARLRQALLTIGVQVTRSVRRLVLHLPRSHPEHAAWHHVACALGAT